MKRILLLIVIGILAGGCFGAIESPEVKFSDPDTYIDDGKVYIERDTNSKMVFKDDGISSAVLLETLVTAGGVDDHGDLLGLGGDDHSQYFNQGRLDTKLDTSESGSGADYINSFPISGAVGDTTNIGDFVSDITVHYKRPGGTAVVGKTNGQFSSISLAIAWLVSQYGTAGGTVRIHPGTYTGGFTMPQNVRLVGEPGVVIEYNNIGGDCIVIGNNALGCELINMTLRSTNTTGQTQAIYIDSGSTLLMRNVYIDWDSSASNTYCIYTLSILTAYDCVLEGPDFSLDLNSDAEWIGGKISNTLSGQTWVVAIGAGSDAIFRDVIIDADGADAGINCDSAGIGYLYDVTIDDAVTDLAGAFGTYYTAGAQYDTVGEFVAVFEITEGRGAHIRHYVEKGAGATDDAYRYRLDGDTRFKIDYLGNIYSAGNLQAENFQGGSNVITVAKSGGDYQTIEDAIDSVTDEASTNTFTILIYPGIYEEQVTIDKSYVGLLGHLPKGADLTEDDNPGVVITYASSGVGSDLMTMLIASGGGAALTGIELANLTIINTASYGTGAAQEALDIGKGDTYGTAKHDVYVRNCSLFGEQDTVFVNSAGNVIFQDCYVEGFFDIVSIADNAKLFNCEFYLQNASTTSNCLWFGRTGDVAFSIDLVGCKFDASVTKTGGGFGVWGHSNVILNVLNCSLTPNSVTNCFNEAGESGTINIFGTNGTGWPGTATFLKHDYINANDVNVVNDIDVGDELTVAGASLLESTVWKYDTLSADVWRFNGANAKIEWWDGSSTWDVNWFRSGPNESTTEDKFIADSIETGTGTAPVNGIGSQGIISSTLSLKSCETRWKDYDAVSWIGSSEWSFTGGNDYIESNADDDYCYFSICYEAGTRISRIRVKCDGGTGIDGVNYRAVKRQDSGTASGWTLVGVQQSVLSDVMVVDTYDIPDFDIDDGYSYAIEVVSVVGGTDVKLYSVGIETIIREW